MTTAPSDAALARAILSPALDLFEFFRGQIERIANDKFEWFQFAERDAFLARETEHLTAIFRLAEEFAPEQLAELVAHLSWKTVLVVRRGDGSYAPHQTIQ